MDFVAVASGSFSALSTLGSQSINQIILKRFWSRSPRTCTHIDMFRTCSHEGFCILWYNRWYAIEDIFIRTVLKSLEDVSPCTDNGKWVNNKSHYGRCYKITRKQKIIECIFCTRLLVDVSESFPLDSHWCMAC